MECFCSVAWILNFDLARGFIRQPSRGGVSRLRGDRKRKKKEKKQTWSRVLNTFFLFFFQIYFLADLHVLFESNTSRPMIHSGWIFNWLFRRETSWHLGFQKAILDHFLSKAELFLPSYFQFVWRNSEEGKEIKTKETEGKIEGNVWSKVTSAFVCSFVWAPENRTGQQSGRIRMELLCSSFEFHAWFSRRLNKLWETGRRFNNPSVEHETSSRPTCCFIYSSFLLSAFLFFVFFVCRKIV